MSGWASPRRQGVASVNTPSSSAFRELAFVFAGDKGNNGKAFATTPGHDDEPSCVE